ncbi:unnamed protein product, partial [Phaeothamnion confervicola]
KILFFVGRARYVTQSADWPTPRRRVPRIEKRTAKNHGKKEQTRPRKCKAMDGSESELAAGNSFGIPWALPPDAPPSVRDEEKKEEADEDEGFSPTEAPPATATSPSNAPKPPVPFSSPERPWEPPAVKWCGDGVVAEGRARRIGHVLVLGMHLGERLPIVGSAQARCPHGCGVVGGYALRPELYVDIHSPSWHSTLSILATADCNDDDAGANAVGLVADRWSDESNEPPAADADPPAVEAGVELAVWELAERCAVVVVLRPVPLRRLPFPPEAPVAWDDASADAAAAAASEAAVEDFLRSILSVRGARFYTDDYYPNASAAAAPAAVRFAGAGGGGSSSGWSGNGRKRWRDGERPPSRPTVPLVTSPSWEAAIAAVMADAQRPASSSSAAVAALLGAMAPPPPPPSVLVCGAKGTGKSALCRLLVNRLLGRYGAVAFIDADTGQPELTPPGLVSAHVITADAPLLGPPHTHLRRPALAFFVGATTAKGDPMQYAAFVRALVAWHRGLSSSAVFAASDGSSVRVGRGGSGGFDVSDFDGGRGGGGGGDGLRGRGCSSLNGGFCSLANGGGGSNFGSLVNGGGGSLPLVVNTDGWIKGMGHDILGAVVDLVQPRHIVRIAGSSPIHSAHVDGPPPGCRVHSVRPWNSDEGGGGGGNGLSEQRPGDARTLRLVTYFSGRCGGLDTCGDNGGFLRRGSSGDNGIGSHGGSSIGDAGSGSDGAQAGGATVPCGSTGSARATCVRNGAVFDPNGAIAAAVAAEAPWAVSWSAVTLSMVATNGSGEALRPEQMLAALDCSIVGLLASGMPPPSPLPLQQPPPLPPSPPPLSSNGRAP